MWEAEEMSCVYFYLTTLMRGFMEHVEDQLVADALSAFSEAHATRAATTRTSPAGAPSHSENPPLTLNEALEDSDLSSTESDMEHDDHVPLEPPTGGFEDADGMIGFDCLELTSLLLFAKNMRDEANDLLSYFASFGSLPLYQLSLANEDRRRTVIRELGWPKRDFLPQAIEVAPAPVMPPDAIPTPTHAINDDSLSCVNLGLSSFERLKKGLYIPIRLHSAHSFLRERAFMFCDSERVIQNSEITRSIHEAASTSDKAARRLYRRCGQKTVEERLEGIRISELQMDRLEQKFGPPEEYQTLETRVISWTDFEMKEENAMGSKDGV